MLFADKCHKDFYNENIKKTLSENDPYRKALFYTLGLTEETRRHIGQIYDFDERAIDFDSLFKPWHTSTSIRVVRLAFNLYNGFSGHDGEKQIDEPSNYTPEELFCCELLYYFLEAVKLRYPEYYGEHGQATKKDIF